MDNQPNRIKTDIAGLDDLLFGGIPETNQVVIAGGPGTGKTLMSFEILYHNAKNGIPVAFIALEEQPKTVIKNAKLAFSKFTDIDALIDKRIFIVDGEDPALKISMSTDSQMYSFGNILSDIEAIVKENNAKVIAIDSITVLKLMLGDPFTYRKAMLSMISSLRRLEVTSIIVSEITSLQRADMKSSQDFFLFDGIINLYADTGSDKRVPILEILKMRGSKHSWMLSPYEITDTGFKVLSGE
ncbi:MAG: ATPase domain-containing protein [Candidatus Micrarchaeia archaeon]